MQVKRWFKTGAYSTGAMNPFLSILAPMVLMLPAAVAVDDARPAAPVGLKGEMDRAGLTIPQAPLSPGSDKAMQAIADYFEPGSAQQVRIEERVTIRIAPRSAATPLMPSMFAPDFDPPPGAPRYIERKIGKCIPVVGILGVQPGEGNRLMLILRDRRMVTASLSRSCQAQAYYSGFLVAKNADGQICQGRDQLVARNGMNCTVTGFRQIVELGD